MKSSRNMHMSQPSDNRVHHTETTEGESGNMFTTKCTFQLLSHDASAFRHSRTANHFALTKCYKTQWLHSAISYSTLVDISTVLQLHSARTLVRETHLTPARIFIDGAELYVGRPHKSPTQKLLICLLCQMHHM